MKFIKLLPASFLAIPFILQLNAQIDCCGLAVGRQSKALRFKSLFLGIRISDLRTPSLVSTFATTSLSHRKGFRLFTSGEPAKFFFKDAEFKACETSLFQFCFQC